MMPASREREAARSRAAQPNPRWSRRPFEAAAQRTVRQYQLKRSQSRALFDRRVAVVQSKQSSKVSK